MKSCSLPAFKLSAENLALYLHKCLKAKALRQGKQVHAVMLTSGIEKNVLSLSSKLIGMYASCADLSSSEYLFKNVQSPNVFALNWMVLSCSFNGYYGHALEYFSLLYKRGLTGNKFTFSTVLKACVGLMDWRKGKQVHAVVTKMGFQSDISVSNSLIDMYCKCRRIVYAREVFDRMVERDVASWTSMISGYCNFGDILQAFDLFKRMPLEGLRPNSFTWNAMIAACARSGDTERTSELLSGMNREGVLLDVITWNALITGFSQSPQSGKAFVYFKDMLNSRVQPNQITLTGLLPACGLTGSIQGGRAIHGIIYRRGFENNVFITSALIDFYSKFGRTKMARNVFDSNYVKNIASWNSMIGCYGKCGMIDSAVELFEKLLEEGLQPNEVTFTCVLSACSHSGSVEIGLRIFRLMKECDINNISNEHYACVIDLLCRSGKMVEAYEFFRDMPTTVVSESSIQAFLNGCHVHGRRDLAQLMVKDVMKMETKKPGGFVTLSNIYAAVGEWEGVEDIRKVMNKNKVSKKPGFSRLVEGDRMTCTETE